MVPPDYREMYDILSAHVRSLHIAQNAYCSRDIYFQLKNVVDMSYRESLYINA